MCSTIKPLKGVLLYGVKLMNPKNSIQNKSCKVIRKRSYSRVVRERVDEGRYNSNQNVNEDHISYNFQYFFHV